MDYSERAITGRVQAAAKLVLQDLDPEAKKRRQEFMSANSTVCLCFHMKKLKNFNKAFFNTSNFAGIQELMLYVRISVGDSSKATKPGEVRKDDGKKIGRNKTVIKQVQNAYKSNIQDGTAEVIFDQVKNFSHEVSRKKDSPANMVLFELLYIESGTVRSIEATAEKAVKMAQGTDDKKKATLMGTAEIHVWELINESNSDRILTLKFKEQKICDLDLEFICKYGPLGYGYSHQLHGLSEKTPAQEVEDSVFFRLPGIDERKGTDDCLLPCHIGHPSLMKVHSNQTSEIGSPIVRAQLWNLSEDSACFLSENTQDCNHLRKLIEKRSRYKKMATELAEKPNRHERMQYLKSKVLYARGSSDKNDAEEHVPELGRRKSEVVKEALENVTHLIELSDGINTRAAGRRNRGTINRDELDNRNMQGGFLGVGMENKRNISVISMNGGNMNFEMQAPYESDEESTDVLDTDLTSSHERGPSTMLGRLWNRLTGGRGSFSSSTSKHE